MLEKAVLERAVTDLERLILSNKPDKAVVTYFNAAKSAENNVSRRLTKSFYHIEHELAKNACRRTHPPKPHFYQLNPDLRNCLKLADVKYATRRASIGKHVNKTYGNLTKADFSFMLANLRDGKAALGDRDDIVRVPAIVHSQPIVSLLLAIDPNKLVSKLPEYLDKKQIDKILNPSLTLKNRSEREMLAKFSKLQSSVKRPQTTIVQRALADMKSDEMNALFREICFDEYKLGVSMLGGGKNLNGALRFIREMWSKLLVWIVVLIVDFIDIVVTCLNLIVFKPIADSIRLLNENSTPTLKTSESKASDNVELFGTKLTDATSVALHKFGKRVTLTLGAEPNYAHKVFMGALVHARSDDVV